MKWGKVAFQVKYFHIFFLFQWFLSTVFWNNMTMLITAARKLVNWQRFQSAYYQFVWVRPLLAKSQRHCKIQFSSSANLYQTCTTQSRMPVPCITVKVFSMLQNSSLVVSVPVIQHVYCSKFLLADKKIPFYIVFISEDAKETIWTWMCLHTHLPTHVI